jgi:hypothetical protein
MPPGPDHLVRIKRSPSHPADYHQPARRWQRRGWCRSALLLETFLLDAVLLNLR